MDRRIKNLLRFVVGCIALSFFLGVGRGGGFEDSRPVLLSGNVGFEAMGDDIVVEL